MRISQKSLLKALSAVFSNLAAAWFGLAFITPTFIHIATITAIFVLIRDIIFGIVFLVFTALIEEIL